jgi:hypothetical protein
MAETPQVESSNTLTVDFQDNPELRSILTKKEVGHKCKLTFELQVMSKYPEGMQLAIEKVITEDGYDDGSEKDADASDKHPIMATIKSKNRKSRGMQGPHGPEEKQRGGPSSRPPQTAQNSAEPWMTSYV